MVRRSISIRVTRFGVEVQYKQISTGVRAHNKSLIPEGEKLSALDHDFNIHGAIPSVLLDIDIPPNKDDSFYSGIVHVTVKYKVFTKSTAMRHAAESINIEMNKPILLMFTDGGPDHRTTFWSVQLSLLATFITLDLDMLISVRTAPSHSYCNPAERCMSLLNLGLQNVALQREPMNDNLEGKVKSATNLKKLRDLCDKQPCKCQLSTLRFIFCRTG